MTTYFVDSSVKKSGDGLTWETALKTESEAVVLIKRRALKYAGHVVKFSTDPDTGEAIMTREFLPMKGHGG